MSYNTEFIDIYKKYIGKGWYDTAINSTEFERWCENFVALPVNSSFDPKICAHFLLNSLILYTNKQMDAIIISILGKLKSKLNLTLEEKYGRRLFEPELLTNWEEYLNQSFFVTAANPSKTGDSAHIVSRTWRNIVDIDIGAVSDLLKNIEKGKKHIFFVDDFIGTGTKMYRFLTDELFPKDAYGFSCVSEVIKQYNEDVDFNIAVYALYDEGKRNLSKMFPSLEIYCGEFYNDEYNLTSSRCTLYTTFDDYRMDIIRYINNKQSELEPDNEFARNLPIAFSHGCPNNSLALYYASSSTWHPLLSESHPKKEVI